MGALLGGVEVGIEHVVGLRFAGRDVDRIPMWAQGVQDGGQACAFMRREIKGEGNEAGHSAPPDQQLRRVLVLIWVDLATPTALPRSLPVASPLAAVVVWRLLESSDSH